MTPCARGCVWIDDDGTEQPSEATYGSLCAWCATRLRDHLEVAATVAGRLRADVMPGLRAASLGERVAGSREQRLPFDVDALELSDEVYVTIATHCDEAVRLLGIQGPDMSHARLDLDQAPAGLRTWDNEIAVYRLTSELADWMLRFLPSIAYLPIIADMHDEIVDVVRRGRRRAGDLPPIQRVARRHCPVCLTRTVEVEHLDDGRARVRCSSCHQATDDFDPAEVLADAT